MSKIRVLHVFGSLNRGGAETMVMNIYRNIDRSKIQFDFIIHTKDKCEYNDEIESLGGRIYDIYRYNGKNHLLYLKAWNEFFDEHSEYKIIHGHIRSTAAIYLKIAKKYGLTTIAHSHSTSNGISISAFIKCILQYPIRYTADYLFACSESAGIWLFGKKACIKENFFVLNNAIDCDRYAFSTKHRKKIRNDKDWNNKFIIGHVGRFCYPKNHEFLLEVFKQVHKKKCNSVLVLVGSGNLEISIREKACNMGLDECVIFLGSRPDVADLLQGMDYFIFPSLYEGLGISVIEAQAAGLPCVVSNNLPKEVFITNLIKALSLGRRPEEWAEFILENNGKYIRQDMTDLIRKAGYDIKVNTNWIQDFYLSIGGNI